MTTHTPLPSLLRPEELMPAVELAGRALAQMDQVLLGRSQLHRMVLTGILSRGHILLEGLPGVGKTAMIKALGQILTLQFRRVQFTPDLMPSDILGTHILRETAGGGREMTFQSGPVFTNILLADEINCASPKTQSALLEAMQERSVTLLGNTRLLPDPFFVLASQNPIELEGTYPLPEAQLDRFLFKLTVSDVSADVLENIITTRRRGEPPVPSTPLSAEELSRLFGVMERMYLPRPVSRYIARLVAASHPGSPEATAERLHVRHLRPPVRGRPLPWPRPPGHTHYLPAGRASVLKTCAHGACGYMNHRLILNYKARFDQIGELAVVQGLLSSLDEAGLNLPPDVQIEKSGKDGPV